MVVSRVGVLKRLDSTRDSWLYLIFFRFLSFQNNRIIDCFEIWLFLAMRWLQNISFSSSSPSSKTNNCDATAALDLKKGNSCEDQHQRRDRRIDGGVPTLTRARKLRHLTDEDVALSSSLRSQASDEPHFAALSRSASSFDHASTSGCSSVVAVPLPLPLPEGKTDLADGEGRLRSTKEVGHCRGVEERERDRVRHGGRGKERDRMDGEGEGMLSNSPISR